MMKIMKMKMKFEELLYRDIAFVAVLVISLILPLSVLVFSFLYSCYSTYYFFNLAFVRSFRVALEPHTVVASNSPDHESSSFLSSSSSSPSLLSPSSWGDQKALVVKAY